MRIELYSSSSGSVIHESTDGSDRLRLNPKDLLKPFEDESMRVVFRKVEKLNDHINEENALVLAKDMSKAINTIREYIIVFDEDPIIEIDYKWGDALGLTNTRMLIDEWLDTYPQ